MVASMLTVCIVLLWSGANAQGMGNGVSKYTRGQSNPRECLAFFEKYLEGQEAPDDCIRGHCECATQGRAQVAGTRLQAPFGVHSINCTYHPYGEHSLADIEAMQTAEVNDFEDGYNQHLDSHLGVWVKDLRTTMEALKREKHPHYAMTWKEGRSSYYSVMAAACGGFYIEFLSEKATGIALSEFHETKEIRFAFGNFSHPEMEYKPLKVSRATTKMDEMIDFYTKVVKGKLVRNVTVDGVNVAWIHLSDAPDVVVQFVNRPPADSAKFTVQDLEDYVNSVHDEYVKSPVCGFDQFADHHWAYDGESRTGTLSSVAKKLTAGGHKYRWFSIDAASDEVEAGMDQIYAFDPSGWTLQLDWLPGNDVPRRLPTYSAACKSNDGCRGQGLCNENQFMPF